MQKKDVNKMPKNLGLKIAVGIILIWLSMLTFLFFKEKELELENGKGRGETTVMLVHEINQLRQKVDKLEGKK